MTFNFVFHTGIPVILVCLETGTEYCDALKVGSSYMQFYGHICIV